MARYRRYRRTIIRAPKKKWASCLISLDGVLSDGTDNNFVYQKLIASNISETVAVPTPVVIKTGNFRTQVDLTLKVSGSSQTDAKAFIFYVPQGILPSEVTYTPLWNLIKQHPEWIIAWKQLDFGNPGTLTTIDTSVVRMSSRLKRNLNSGDSVFFFIIGTGNFTGITSRGTVSGAVQFWTCAN